MLSPSSRLTDDLYTLYLAAMLWIFLPFWASFLAEALPSQWDEFNRWFDFAVVGAGFLGAWSGLRGGPLMLPRSAIVHELGSPLSKRLLLFPWLVRQTTAWALVTGVLATIMLVLANRDAFTYSEALAVSVVAVLVTVSSMCVAITCLAAVRGNFHTRALGIAAALMLAAPGVALIAAGSFTTTTGMIALAALTIVNATLALYSLEGVSVELLWKRAWAVEAMRSSTHNLDFQRVLLDLRNATERPPYASNHLPGLRRLPRSLWRHLAGVQHTWKWHVARLSAITTLLALLVWHGTASEGMVALAIGGSSLLLGMEFSGALAATADQPIFVVHYPHGSRRVLQGQAITTVALPMSIATLVTIGKIDESYETVAGVLLIVIAGALGASVQARLGSPDLAAMITRFGESISMVLWFRAMLGPVLVLATTILVFHQFFRPNELQGPFGIGIAALLVAGFLITTSPLEKAAR